MDNYEVRVGDNPDVFLNPTCDGEHPHNNVRVECDLKGRFVGIAVK